MPPLCPPAAPRWSPLTCSGGRSALPARLGGARRRRRCFRFRVRFRVRRGPACARGDAAADGGGDARGVREAREIHWREHPAAGGPARWHLLLPPAPGPCLLREREAAEGGHERPPRQPGRAGHLLREVHQDAEVPAQRHGAGFPRTLRQVQGVGEAWLRAVLPLRQPRAEVGPGPHHREHGPVPGRGGVLHGRRPAGIWGGREVHPGLQEGGPHGDRGVPPGRRRGVRAERGHADLAELRAPETRATLGRTDLVPQRLRTAGTGAAGSRPCAGWQGQRHCPAPAPASSCSPERLLWCCDCIKPFPSFVNCVLSCVEPQRGQSSPPQPRVGVTL